VKHVVPVQVSSAFIASTCFAIAAAAQVQNPDPVPHEILEKPYRVCQDLEELTSRIDNLYRKPYAKLFDANGVVQPETVIFKDTRTGHEIISLTRELCTDIAHADLARPVWTIDGSRILFMGNRAMVDTAGQIKKTEWQGKMFVMDADYTQQRSLVVEIVDDAGNVIQKRDGMPGKYNILDPIDPRITYYADGDTLYQMTLSDDPARPSRAKKIGAFATPHRKIIQAISRDRKLLIQDYNADPDRKTGKLPYMPEIHLVDLSKQPGEPGYYDHHPFDYGLPEVRDASGKVLHDAKNNFQFHSLMFGDTSNSIGWNYGPMTSVGEYLGWSLDITNGLDGTPKHGPITDGAGGNPFNQYESHGRFVDGTRTGLYFSGPAVVNGQKTGTYGLWMRDYAKPEQPPTFITGGPGGHVAGGESVNPFFFAAHIHATSHAWRQRVEWSDAIVFGDVREPEKARPLVFTYSDVRGGTRVDRATGKRVWSGPDNNDYRPYTSIPRPLLSRDATKVWFHSSMLMPTEDWTGIYVATLRRPDAPTDLKVTPRFDKDGTAELSWKPAPHAVETRGFRVYRIDADAAPVELTSVPIPARVDGELLDQYTFTDTKPNMNATASTYFVTAEEWSGLESDTTSNAVGVALVLGGGARVEDNPAIKHFDQVAPAPVTSFSASKEPDAAGQYRLKWEPSTSSDVRYYNVYFSTRGRPEITQKRLIASPLKSMTTYLDWSAPIEGNAHYAITAVDRQGNESTPVHAP
jgi:hypothetical protein